MTTLTDTPSLPALALANAHFVTPYLAVGGDLAFDDETAVTQAVELIDVGVTHVLDVRYEAEDAELWRCFPEITYRWDGIDDAGQRVPAAWFDGIVDWALAAIRAARPIAHVWYAEDALERHLERTGADAAERRTTRGRVARWREENPLDVVRIIRAIRAEEGH